MDKLSFILFLSIVSLIYFGMNYYVFHRVANGLALPPQARNWLKLFFLAGGLSFFLGEYISRNSISTLSKALYFFGMSWLGVLSLALTIFALRDVILLFVRNNAFRHYSTVVSLVLLFAASAYALYNASRNQLIKEIRVVLPGLPAASSGFAIVQLSDLHLHFLSSPRRLEEIVHAANGLKPDLIVITGDLIDANLCKLDGFCDILKKLSAPHGVYAITGNHEYYTGVNIFMNVAERSGMTALRNRRVSIGDAFDLAGIDDKEISSPAESLPLVLPPRDPALPAKPVVLLAHRPDVFEAAAERGAGLVLSGHTHAGQLPPVTWLVRLAFKYPFGHHTRGTSSLYTTSGTGIWGPPMRLFSRSEIVKIVLEKQ